MIPLLMLSGCTAVLNIQSSTPGTTVYVTDYIPSSSAAPTMYEASGTTPYVCEINYVAWEQYYVWVEAPGGTGHIQQIPNEVKPAPLVGALLCMWPLAVWAYGPTESPIYVDIPVTYLPDTDQPVEVLAEGGDHAGWCYPDEPTPTEEDRFGL